MGIPLKTVKRRRHTTLCSFKQRVRRAEVVRGEPTNAQPLKLPLSFAARLCHPVLSKSSPVLFVLQF
ncbi:MAG: hypothetical protein JW836_12415 [Deltaproteobacteria bacterium]|nr:hypothetical protein [Deltaproteobacteria bacterium]